MLFNSPVFLFLFLPVVLGVYWILNRLSFSGQRLSFGGQRLPNLWLGVASLFFYCWGEPLYFPIILISILANYGFGRVLGRFPQDDRKAKWTLVTGVAINLGLLLFFKDYAVYWLNGLGTIVFAPFSVVAVAFTNAASRLAAISYLPLGISFFTFSTISYLVDVSKKRCPAENNLFNFGLYVLLFPKIIAGPIVRYSELARQLSERSLTLPRLAGGARRFATGFSKKVLVADTLSGVVNQVFAINACRVCPYHLTPGLAWLGVIFFSLQIYFDFSGYSDMAIGLGQMLGFKFVENFDYPYISRSITEFWRRWHISLSNWFRDYVFYPLERRSHRLRSQHNGSGSTFSAVAPYANILIVFLLTGLWHGAAVNFVVWGLLHGSAIALERGPFGKWLKAIWRPWQHLYALGVMILGWVFFRTEDLGAAYHYLKSMLGLTPSATVIPFNALTPLEPYVWVIALISALLALPLQGALKRLTDRWSSAEEFARRGAAFSLIALQDILIYGLLVVAVIFLSSSTHQAYIYMRF